MKRFLFACSAVLLLLAPAASASEQGVRAFAENLAGAVISVAKDASLTAEGRRASFERLFLDNVDVNWMGRFALGRHWRDASEDQRRDYLLHYRDYLALHYATRFADYRGESFRVLGVRSEGPKTYGVTMEILRPSDADVRMEYKVREADNAYKVQDIILEGVSLMTTQRADFGAVVSKKGLDRLIELLARKARSAENANETNG